MKRRRKTSSTSLPTQNFFRSSTLTLTDEVTFHTKKTICTLKKKTTHFIRIIRRLEINPRHIPAKRMRKLTSCTHAYEKDFLFISSVLDPKPTNKHITHASNSSRPENEPTYEKVV